jgi:hypothetical protein
MDCSSACSDGERRGTPSCEIFSPAVFLSNSGDGWPERASKTSCIIIGDDSGTGQKACYYSADTSLSLGDHQKRPPSCKRLGLGHEVEQTYFDRAVAVPGYWRYVTPRSKFARVESEVGVWRVACDVVLTVHVLFVFI